MRAPPPGGEGIAMAIRGRGRWGRPDISVVVATYGREKILCETLTHLLDQDHPNYELIVVDQTPVHEPGTEEFLRSQDHRLRHLRLVSASLPNARNVGIRAACGDLVLFIDDDVLPARSLVSAHTTSHLSDRVAGVGGQVLSPTRETVDASATGRLDRATRVTWNFNSTVSGDTMYATGCNMSFRRDLLIRAGLFEVAFGGNAECEEVDLCLRLRRLGYTIRFVPAASLVHLEQVVGGCGNRRRDSRWFYWHVHNHLLLALRHPTLFSPVATIHARVHSVMRELRDPSLIAPLALAVARAPLTHARARASLRSTPP